MAEKELRYRLTGTDAGAGKAISGVGEHGSKSAALIGKAFSSLGNQIGGEVGELSARLGEAFDKIGEKGGKELGEKLLVGGTAVLALGAGLTAMGSREKQATDQLKQAVENSGHSFEEFKPKVEEAVHSMEHYGYTAVQTKDALTTLTNATHDPEKATRLMAEAADLAAAKHMSLDDAAKMLAKTLGGSARLFREYGITVQKNADGTKDYAGANERLAQVIHGQADAASNNLLGTFRRLRAEVEDNIAAFGQKFGPAITATGATMMAIGPIMSGASSLFGKLGGAAKGASDVAIASDDAAATSTSALAGSVEASTGSQLTSFSQVATGAESASNTAIAADEAAEASTESLAATVQASSGQQVAAFATVATAAEREAVGVSVAESETAAATRTASTTVVEANTAAAGSFSKLIDSIGPLSGVMMGATGGFFLWNQELASAKTQTGEFGGSIAKGGLALDAFIPGVTVLGDKLSKLLGIGPNSARAIDGVGHTADIAQIALRAFSGAADQNSQSLEKEKFDAQEVSNAFQGLNTRLMTAYSASLSFKDAEAQVTQAFKQNGVSLNDNTTKGRANVETMLSAIQAAQQHATAVYQQTHNVDKATVAFNDDRQALIDHYVQLGFNRQAVERLVYTYGRMPTFKNTAISQTGIGAAMNNAQNYLNLLGRIGQPVFTQIGNSLGGAVGGAPHPRQHAAGTDYAPGGSVLVAEREAEIIDLPRGSRLTPISKARSAMPSASGPAIGQLTIQAPTIWPGSTHELAQMLVGMLEDWVNRGGQLRIGQGVVNN